MRCAEAAAVNINFYIILERNIWNSKSHEKHIYSSFLWKKGKRKYKQRLLYTTDVYDKPFYFIAATKMNFYSCNLIMEYNNNNKERAKNSTYIRIACLFHQLSADDYSVLLLLFINDIFFLLCVVCLFVCCYQFSSLADVCMRCACALHMSLFVCSLLCLKISSFWQQPKYTRDSWTRILNFGWITNKGNLWIYQVYGHKIWLSKEWD